MGSCCGAGEGWAVQEAGRVRVEGTSWPHPTWEAAGPGGGLQIWGAGNSPESDPSPPLPGPRLHQPPKWSPGSALSQCPTRPKSALDPLCSGPHGSRFIQGAWVQALHHLSSSPLALLSNCVSSAPSPVPH